MTDDDQQLDASGLDLPRLLDRAEDVILRGPRKYTADQVAQRAGMDREEARQLWKALGFPTVPDDEVAFTDGDLDALRKLRELAGYGFADADLRLAVARVFGQTFWRLASYQGQLLVEQLAQRPELLASEDTFAELVDKVTPTLEQLQSYAWRRQLAAYIARLASQGTDQITAGPQTMAIGFADMSRFTSWTRKVSEAELSTALETFEAMSTEIVGQHGGRIVKTIGDEVLFQADEPAHAAEIALQLVESAEGKDDVPELRAGLAYGPVVSRLGDVYGSTVNIASRLTSIARPGWVLVDRQLHDAIEDDERFRLRARRPESVRGFHHLHSWRLRRP
ncbi:MAG TPA: adenylate/guanylate cyclase domain-containing protein [Jatrophihabitantaceae bacterium]|nr:adenylate/guanylate cyclase domain-containing protein [Jatrophihabitantaceae bacterium]